MADVSLMVFPSPGGADGTPQFLIHKKGVWLMVADSSPAATELSQMKKKIEDDLYALMREVEGPTPPETLIGLENKCEAYYRSIVPLSLDRILGTAAAESSSAPVLRIYIHPQLEWIPWEILRDTTNYVGLRFQVARIPIVQTGPEPDDEPHPVRLVYNLLGKGVVKPTDPLFKPWEQMFGALIGAKGQEFRRPMADDWPSIVEVDKAAKDASDIVHLTCHGGLKDSDSGQSYWTLNLEKDSRWEHRLNREVVSNWTLRNRPLIFGNACASAQIAGPNSASATFPPGLGTELFDKGAVAFIGTFAPITKRLAFGFAARFYGFLLQGGIPVGQALWETKRWYQEAGENDPSWLFYCLYGPPDTRFAPT